MKKIILMVLLAPSLSYAFFCPGNFSQIDYGMTIAQVGQICGAPAKQNKFTKTLDNKPQEWTYYIPQTVSVNPFQQTVGTMKTSFAFDANGQAVNISVNGIGVGATTICGITIQLGTTREQVQQACGNPSFINRQNAPGTAVLGQVPDDVVNVVEYQYNSNPPVTLVFENGILKSTK